MVNSEKVQKAAFIVANIIVPIEMPTVCIGSTSNCLQHIYQDILMTRAVFGGQT
jgi:hypothetical protein